MALTTATLSGPSSGVCGLASTNFSVDLDDVAPTGGISVAITSSVGGDTITSTPLVIPAGFSFGFFTITPSSAGSRNVSITTTPALTIAGSPVAYNATTNCPDDAGGTSRTANWSTSALVCPPTFHVDLAFTPSTPEAIELYGTTGPLTLVITE